MDINITIIKVFIIIELKHVSSWSFLASIFIKKCAIQMCANIHMKKIDKPIIKQSLNFCAIKNRVYISTSFHNDLNSLLQRSEICDARQSTQYAPVRAILLDSII